MVGDLYSDGGPTNIASRMEKKDAATKLQPPLRISIPSWNTHWWITPLRGQFLVGVFLFYLCGYNTLSAFELASAFVVQTVSRVAYKTKAKDRTITSNRSLIVG